MKMPNSITIISLATILIFSSCLSKKKLTYLQYSERQVEKGVSISDVWKSVTPAAYKIMPYDNLYIRVLTPDPQWSSLFNAEAGIGGMTMESAALTGYVVDNQGNIEIPYVGKVPVMGKTISETKIMLDSIFKDYVADAALTVRLVNNFISIIGEVDGPGRYALTKDQMNIFEAISMAGDVGDYGNRQRIQLIRPTQYGPVIKEFSLLDRSILNSEYYYLMPNDIIYVMPMRGAIFQINSGVLMLFLTTITSALGILAFFRTL